MKEKRYLLSLVTVYLCYFTHGMQAIILSQNKVNFYTQWGYTDAVAGAAAVSLAVTATGFGKFLSVWIGGTVSDKIGRKKMAMGGAILYVLCFIGLLFSRSFAVACACSFIAGVATSGFWDASLYPVAQESVEPHLSGSALVGIKLFVSLSGIVYPLIVVKFSQAGMWRVNIWIPLVLSIICCIVAAVAPFLYDDQIKTEVKGSDGNSQNAAQKEIEELRAKQLVAPNGFTKFLVMFFAVLFMFIMYGEQQYTKAFGMSHCGLTEIQSAALTSVYTFGSIIAVIFWAVMMGKLRWRPLKVVLIDAIFTAVALAMVLLVNSVAVIYIAIALLGFFAAGGALQTGLAVVQNITPGPRGKNTGIYYTFMGAASVALPYAVSAMTKSIGEDKAVFTMMILLLIAAIVEILGAVYLLGQHKKIFGYSALQNDTEN